MAANPRPIPATPENLEKVLRHRPLLWVGAGTSIAAGHPGTGTLVEELIAEADDPIDPELRFEQVADAFVESMGTGALEDLLQRVLGASCPLTDLHRALARRAAEGAFAAIVTTNYDDLLERALGEEEVRFIFQSLEENAAVTDADSDLRLLKLHGSRADWQRTVLSGDAYTEFGPRYPFLQEQLDQLLRHHRVLFVGCSLQDPRILDWLSGLDAEAAKRLKPWRALVTEAEWQAALEVGGDAIRRGNLRPLVLEDHGQLSRLWVGATPEHTAPGEVELMLKLSEAGLEAELGGHGSWNPPNPLGDGDLVAAVEALRELSTAALPADDHGVLAPAAASAAALLRDRAVAAGERLTALLLTDDARAHLRAIANAGRVGQPALLRLRLAVPPGGGEDLERQAERLLALPWELLRLDGVFPVEEHSLDLAREVVVEGVRGLAEPNRPLTVVATVAAPVDAVELDHEGEMYRLWQALGAGGEHRLSITDLGTVEDLFDAVELQKPPVVHFTGHGRPGELIFEDKAALARPIGVQKLARRLRDAGLPRLIYLSACHGATAGSATAGGRLGLREGSARRSGTQEGTQVPPATAASLHRAGFAQVVAYFGPVGDALASRTAASFYTGLAAGLTARAALRRARRVASEAVAGPDGWPRGIYPLGWAQLALYHRGADVATALAAPAEGLAPRRESPRRRIFERLDKAGGSIRVEGIEGVQQLLFGFIGRRRPRGDAIRRWRRGQRLLVVEGFGGLGKTALCGELLRILGAGRATLVFDGRHARAQPEPLAALWEEIEAADDDPEWRAELGELQRDGLSGEALARAVVALAEREGGLTVYLDDAESLLEEPGEGSRLGCWRDAETKSFWETLVERTVEEGSLAVLASTRYRPEGTPEEAVLPLEPMSRWEISRLMSWMPTLRRLPHADREWLVEKIDGHPRTVEYLEALVKTAERRLAPPGGRFEGEWRAKILEPELAKVGPKLEADLLLPEVWRALDTECREHLGVLSVLSAAAPWEAILEWEPVEGTTRTLLDAGLISPFQNRGELWWAPHRLVSEKVAGLWQGDPTEAHRRVGRWFLARFEGSHDLVSARRAVEHLCKAGDADVAWPAARALVLDLRRAGRYRQALVWVDRVLAAEATGPQRGLALMFRTQLRRFAGTVTRQDKASLEQALDLANESDRGTALFELAALSQLFGRLEDAATYLSRAIAADVEHYGEESSDVATSLHSLAGVLQAQGDLAGARRHLERSLEIQAAVFGTEEHPSVAASLHELAGVLKAQGDLAEARRHLERVLEIEGKVYGTREHYSSAITEMALGHLLIELEEEDEGRKLLAHAHGVFARQLGPEHPFTKQTQPYADPPTGEG